MRLQEKVAIITGAGQGIGRATALKFAAEGATVAVVDVVEDTGEATVEQIVRNGGSACFLRADVTRRDEVEAMVRQVQERFERVDVLVNNAGILRDAQLLKMSEADFDAVLAVNLKGAFHCTQAVAPLMIARGTGCILNASSVVALYGNFGQTNYVASKAGLIGMTKVWARELGRKGIRVNAVAPGFIATEMVQAIPPKIAEAMIARVPLRRLGLPEEVANVYAFLASDEAAYVNGAVISVDGGVVV